MKKDKQHKCNRQIADFPCPGVGARCDLLGVLPPLVSRKITALEPDAEPQARPARFGETEVKLLHVLADVTTGVWRMRRKMASIGGEASADLRVTLRHLESTWDVLAGAGIEVGDPAGEKYVNGMALRVIAFQPTEGVHVETIAETIKPAVFYEKNLIQMGEVIVATPVEANRTPDTP